MKTYLVTGAAGFIGYHLAQYLLQRDVRVVGIDNLNDYYDVQLKRDRLARLTKHADFVQDYRGNLAPKSPSLVWELAYVDCNSAKEENQTSQQELDA